MRAALILNPGAGGGGAEQRRTALEALRAAGVEATPIEAPPAQYADAAEQAGRRFDAVVAAGGDGTVSAVAGGLVGSDTPLGVLPLGTLNHFAGDLGLEDVEQAAAAIAAGATRRVDVGEVNGRVFVNNSSIGAYALAVTIRERLQAQHGLGKWPAMARAAVTVLAQLPVMSARVRTDGEEVQVRTPLVLVGNNEYEVAALPPGGRRSLDDGCLSVYTVHAEGRVQVLRLALRGLVRRLEAAESFDARLATALEIDVRRSSLRVAVDGEVCRMRPPLVYRVRPRSLLVLAPPPEPD